MDNKTEYFTLKEDGVIGWIENYPHEPDFTGVPSELYENYCEKYDKALQSAIASAVEVNDVDQLVMKKIYGQHGHVDGLPENFYAWRDRSVGKVFSLQCHVEKKTLPGIVNKDYAVALVTFSEPEKCKHEPLTDTGVGYNHCPACGYSEPEDRPSTSSIVRKFERFLDNRKNPPFKNEPSAGVEETQEELFDELLSKYFKIVRSDHGSGWLAVQELMNQFTITRKNK